MKTSCSDVLFESSLAKRAKLSHGGDELSQQSAHTALQGCNVNLPSMLQDLSRLRGCVGESSVSSILSPFLSSPSPADSQHLQQQQRTLANQPATASTQQQQASLSALQSFLQLQQQQQQQQQQQNALSNAHNNANDVIQALLLEQHVRNNSARAQAAAAAGNSSDDLNRHLMALSRAAASVSAPQSTTEALLTSLLSGGSSNSTANTLTPSPANFLRNFGFPPQQQQQQQQAPLGGFGGNTAALLSSILNTQSAAPAAVSSTPTRQQLEAQLATLQAALAVPDTSFLTTSSSLGLEKYLTQQSNQLPNNAATSAALGFLQQQQQQKVSPSSLLFQPSSPHRSDELLSSQQQQQINNKSKDCNNNITYSYEGDKLVPLAMSSEQWVMSEYQCLLRQQIVFVQSAVTARNNDGKTQGRNKPIVPGQVGILCKHCASLAAPDRPRGAIYYPAKLHRIYQAAQNMAHNHFASSCKAIPEPVRQRLLALKEQKAVTVGAGKEYWHSAAVNVGVREGENGLYLCKD